MPFVKKSPLPAPRPSAEDWRMQATLLQTGTADERWPAARALASEPNAIPALTAALARSTNSSLKEAIFTSLAKQNSIAAFDAVLGHLRSDDAELRSFALDAMRFMPEQTASRLPALLKDDDADIRVLACELARQIPQNRADSVLAWLLKAETQVNVCAAAIEVLAEIGSSAELSSLVVCFDRFPAEFFLNFSVKAASEQIRARRKPI